MDWASLIERLGFPIVVSGVLLWILWKTIRPVSEAHIETIVSLRETNKQNAETLSEMGRTLTSMSEVIRSMEQILDRYDLFDGSRTEV